MFSHVSCQIYSLTKQTEGGKQSHNQLARRCKKQERLSRDSLLSPDYTLPSVLYNGSVYRQWHHQVLVECKMRTFTLVDVDIWDSPYQWRQSRTDTDWWLMTDWLTVTTYWCPTDCPTSSFLLLPVQRFTVYQHMYSALSGRHVRCSLLERFQQDFIRFLLRSPGVEMYIGKGLFYLLHIYPKYKRRKLFHKSWNIFRGKWADMKKYFVEVKI